MVTVKEGSSAASTSLSTANNSPSSSSQTTATTTQVMDEAVPSTISSVPPSLDVALPASFVGGQWIGTVSQAEANPFPVRISLDRGSLGEQVGIAEYASMECSGRLILLRATEKELTVQLRMRNRGVNRKCEEIEYILTLKMLPDGALEYEIKSVRAFARLSKTN
jgi:hypothetical protein